MPIGNLTGYADATAVVTSLGKADTALQPAAIASGTITPYTGNLDLNSIGGTGDMQTLIYDPRGFAADAFDLSNFTGAVDGGVFT